MYFQILLKGLAGSGSMAKKRLKIEVPYYLPNKITMKKIILTLTIAVLTAFLFSSCNKENDADYVLKVGDSFCLDLIENPSLNKTWEWINSDKIEIISMTRTVCLECSPYSDTSMSISDTSITLGGLATYSYCFKAEKVGYCLVQMVYGKDDPDGYQRKIHFSIRVID